MTPPSLQVLFTPAESAVLNRRDLSDTVCIVFDILRATSTMMTALANGAREIVPVSEIEEALAVRRSRPEVILAGERNGLRIGADQTGGVEFDLGNSPREFSVENVSGKTIIMTTTNGTRALRACTAARTTLIGSFLGLRAIANWITAAPPRNLLLVCAGTLDQAAYEDALAAGGLCELICPDDAGGTVSDSAQIARQLYRAAQEDLFQAAKYGRNARRLLANPELRDDVAICLRRDVFGFLAGLSKDGAVRRLS